MTVALKWKRRLYQGKIKVLFTQQKMIQTIQTYRKLKLNHLRKTLFLKEISMILPLMNKRQRLKVDLRKDVLT